MLEDINCNTFKIQGQNANNSFALFDAAAIPTRDRNKNFNFAISNYYAIKPR